MRSLAHVLITLAMITLSSFSYAQCGTPVPMLCDIDGDRDVDQNDIKTLTLAKGTPVSGPGDIRDMDGDGMITVLDARKCVAYCTGGNCAISDKTPPILTIDTPKDGAVFEVSKATITGTAKDAGGVDGVTINGIPANLIGDNYTLDILLVEGANTVNVIAKDTSGNAASASITVTYKNDQSSNQPPVAIAQSSSGAMGFAKVTLDGSLSIDPDGKIDTYSWTQKAGPQVALQSSSEPIASFNAPIFTSSTLLRFQLQVKDDQGATSNAEVAVEVFPADGAQLEVKFIALEYLKPSTNQDSHADYFPVPGSPIANENIKMIATLSGLVKDVAFEFRGLAGNMIAPASLTRLDDLANPPFDFGGDVKIPTQPFNFVAFGNTHDGQAFEVTFPTPATPEQFSVLFSPRLIDLEPGQKLPVTLFIENGGQKDIFEVVFSDLHGLLASSFDTSLEIDTGATNSVQLEITTPTSKPLVDPTPLRVYVTAQSNPNKQLAAELLLTVEDAP